MEKYKITSEFTDKHTGEGHAEGSVKEFTAERAAEILTAGNYIEKVEAEKVTPTPAKVKAK